MRAFHRYRRSYLKFSSYDTGVTTYLHIHTHTYIVTERHRKKDVERYRDRRKEMKEKNKLENFF